MYTEKKQLIVSLQITKNSIFILFLHLQSVVVKTYKKKEKKKNKIWFLLQYENFTKKTHVIHPVFLKKHVFWKKSQKNNFNFFCYLLVQKLLIYFRCHIILGKKNAIFAVFFTFLDFVFYGQFLVFVFWRASIYKDLRNLVFFSSGEHTTKIMKKSKKKKSQSRVG